MCTTKELIAYLQTLPENTEVEVLQQYYSNWDTSTRWVPLDIKEYSNNCNKYTDTLYLGED